MEWYIIPDLDKFAQATRVMIYNMWGENVEGISQSIDISNNTLYDYENLEPEKQQELDHLISLAEAVNIIKEYATITSKGETKLTEERYEKVVESMNERLVSNMVMKLAKDGYLEIAFSEEENDFVFWVADKKKNDKRKN